jgi:hypothetical protein
MRLPGNRDLNLPSILPGFSGIKPADPRDLSGRNYRTRGDRCSISHGLSNENYGMDISDDFLWLTCPG